MLAPLRTELDNQVATKAADVADFQKGLVSKFLATDEPDKVAGAAIRQGASSVRDLVSRVQSSAQALGQDPADAMAGLKRAVIDHMVGPGGNLINTAGQLQPEMFGNFVRKNDAALGQIFSADEMGRLQNIVADIQRAQLSDATRLGAGSDTAQNQSLIKSFLGSKARYATEAFAHGSGMTALLLHGGWPVALSGLILDAGATGLRAAVASGKSAINRTTAAAMADPAYAGQIMGRVSPPTIQNALTSSPARMVAPVGALINNLTTSDQGGYAPVPGR